MSRTDYIVKDLGEDTIAFKAEQLRGQLGLINSNTFSLTDAVENLETFDFGKKGRLSVVLINAPPSGTPAKVRFNPLNLIIDKEVYKYTKLGDPYGRWVISHEIGHIVLHGGDDNLPKRFSNEPSSRVKSVPLERSAEWQADCFAYYFLLPDRIVKTLKTPQHISQICGVEHVIAANRIDMFQRRYKIKL